VTRERIARALLRAYPTHTRASLGAEIVGTVLDSSDASARRFARECGTLVMAGMRARARVSASESVFRQLADGYILAGQIWLAVLLSHATGQFLRQPAQGLGGGLVFVLALWPILGLSLIGARRTAGTAATTWFVCSIVLFGLARPSAAAIWLIPFTGWLVMAVCQQNRPRELRRLAWLAPVVILSLLPPSQGLAFNTVDLGVLILGSIVAVAIFPLNPRLLVACGVVWTGVALMSTVLYYGLPPVHWLALSAPVVLLATTGRVVLARRLLARL
jgi:hypothetical protein